MLKNKLKWNIRNQIMITGVFGLIAIVGVISYFYNFTKGEFTSNSRNLIETLSARAGDQLSRHFDDMTGTFGSWTSDDVFGLSIEFNTTTELSDQFTKWIGESNDFVLIALVDANGKVLEAAGAEGYNNKCRELIGRRLSDLSDIHAGDEPVLGYVVSETLGDIGVADSRSYLFYRPAYSSSGNHNGGFVAYADWGQINNLLTDCTSDLEVRGLAGTWSALIIPGTRQTLVGLEGQLSVSAEKLSSDIVSNAQDLAAMETGDMVLAGTDFTVSPRHISAPKIVGAEEELSAPVLLISVPEESVVAQLNSTLSTIIVIGVVCTLMMLAVSYIISKRISSRVNKVTSMAKLMSVGEINQQFNVSGNDEIAELNNSFKKLTEYLTEMSDVANRIANGDLRVTVKPYSKRDQLGSAFETMAASLNKIILELNSSASTLLSASAQINESSRQVSSATQSQEQQIVQVSTAIEEMTANIIQSSTNAAQASDGAQSAARTAGDGGNIVSETVSGMRNIASVVRESAQSIANLAKAADQIGNITSVIDDIADQTNLLALNAAIEAARAGDQGRGFAVVADEVRKLAERTGNATGEINGMIKGIQGQTEEAVLSMESGIQEVDRGREMADRAGNSLSEIVKMSQKVLDMIQQIASGTEEQSAAAEEISKTVEQVANTSRESAKAAKQSESAADNLSSQAQKLREIVGQFKVVASE